MALLEFVLVALLCLPFTVLPLGWARWLGSRLILATALLSAKRLRRAESNFELALRNNALRDTRPAHVLARECYMKVGRTLAEVSRMAYGNMRGLIRETRIEGREHYDAAIAKGNGMVLVTGHIGNWERLGTVISKQIAPGFGIAKKQKNPYINRAIDNMRARSDSHIVHKEGAVRHALRALRENKFVYVVMDEATREESGVFVDFLGFRMPMLGVAPLLAQRTGAVVLPCLMEHDGVVRIGPPVEITGNMEADTQSIARYFERYISEHPTEWMLWTKKWAWLKR